MTVLLGWFFAWRILSGACTSDSLSPHAVTMCRAQMVYSQEYATKARCEAARGIFTASNPHSNADDKCSEKGK